MEREEKLSIAYGAAGWFLIIHYSVIILNNVISELTSFIVLAGRSIVDAGLIRGTLFSLGMRGLASVLLISLGIALIFAYKRRLKSVFSKRLKLNSNDVEIKPIVFSVVGMLIIVMSINSIITVTIFQYRTLALLLKGIAFSSNVLLVIPQYLLSIMEGIFGLYLLLTFSKKKASVTNKTESIEA
jgi:hypothetical protein